MKSLSLFYSGYVVKGFFLIALSVSMFGCSGGGGASGVINAMVEAYGGEENLKKLNSYSQLWNMNALAKQDIGNDVRYVEQPDRLRVELYYTKSSAEQRIINGTKGFSSMQGGAKNEAKGPQLSAMKVQRARMYTALTLKLKIESLTHRQEGGHNILSLKEGEVTTSYYINVDTNLIDKVVGAMSMGGRNMEFVTEYSDYRNIEGVMVAHKENKFAMGMNTAENTLKEIRLSETFVDGFFL